MSVTEAELDLNQYDADMTSLARTAMWGSWSRRSNRRALLERLRDYANGRGGIPDIDEGATEELRDLAKLSPLNMCGVVVKTFNRGLSVVGFRSPTSADDDPAWAWWQSHRMDARQSQVHKAALTYRESFVSVLPHDASGDPARPAIWSPLSAVVEYDDPREDLFPKTAMLMRRTAEGWSVLLVDDTMVTPGILRVPSGDVPGRVDGVRKDDVVANGEPWAHGATYDGQRVCPVVRFVNEFSDDDAPPTGVVEPIITLNRAMNAVNFDRLVVARHGAHVQKLIIGWSAPAATLLKMSSSKIGVIDESPEDVRVESFPASSLTPYNELLREMREQVALEAAIPLWAAGNISNVSTDTAAMIEAAHQRELQIKREAFGESWEQLLRLAVEMSGLPMPDQAAEMVWRETQARAFGAVVDGIQKLASIPGDAGGIPVEDLLDMIPGMTQQKQDLIRDSLRRRRTQVAFGAVTAAVAGSSAMPAPADTAEADVLKAKFDALGIAIRAGVEPVSAAALLGLTGITFTGAVPVTLRMPEAAAQGLEGGTGAVVG